MHIILPAETFTPFDAATIAAMNLAFNTAWQQLLASGSEIAASTYADATREALAMHIVDLAQGGERDVLRLRDGAVVFVLQALQSKQA